MIAAKTNIPDILEWLDVDNLHVHAPTDVVLLCGGEVNITSRQPTSLRDAFLRIKHNPPLNKLTFRLAEEANIYGPNSNYSNWMDFESDLAQICQLILLFCESNGSLAELGTFASIDEVARKLSILIDSYNNSQKSYIKYGPIEAVTKEHGTERLFVMHLADLGLETIEKVAQVDLAALKQMLAEFVVESMNRNRDPRTFDATRNGHRIKLVTGMVQHYGALTVEELEVIFFALGLSASEKSLKKFLDCAEFLEWVKLEPRGTKDFYVALQDKDAFEYALVSGSPTLNKGAWRAMVRAYWSDKEPDRFSAITANPLRARK